MCGIGGAIGAPKSNVTPTVLQMLKNVEYRGYDSAGIAVLNGDIKRVRKVGKIAVLEKAIKNMHLNGNVAIGHTRWATHGGVTEANAHPHQSDEIVLAHNGIIQNHEKLRKELIAAHYAFESETDTEVVAHLVHYYYARSRNLVSAVREAVKRLEGAYALIICSLADTSVMIGVSFDAPLLIGFGKKENYLASDAITIAHKTNRVSYLKKGDIAVVEANKVQVYGRDGRAVTRKVVLSKNTGGDSGKGKYAHYMQKEMFEQPKAISNTLERVLKKGVSPKLFGATKRELRRIKAVRFLACGTSSYAGRAAAQWFEEIVGIPAYSEIASEYRYRKIANPNKRELIVTISQSGETADTMEALKHALELGQKCTLSICNVMQSSIPRMSKFVFYTKAGVEKGVASTKAFTTQLVSLFTLALAIAKAKGKLSKKKEEQYLRMLRELPESTKQALNLEPEVRRWAGQIATKHHALFLGRGTHHSVALEGALKLKEVSYIHAEAYPAGELKHGPIALIDENMPVIVVAPNDNLFDKIKSNISEVRARGARVYVITDEGSSYEPSEGIEVIRVPRHASILSPAMHVILMQLLAYHAGLLLGCDVDQPRNLAKSVTVE